jgi:hypothetical protein
MSLETVIKIGKFYRQDKDAWKYHEQINHVMKDVEALAKDKDKDGNPVTTTFYEVPVIDKGDEFFFDFDNKAEILDEDKKKSLYYLNFKTSKKDAEKRYLFGDIIYSCYVDKKNAINESGNYRLNGKWINKSSFVGAEPLTGFIKNNIIIKFRNAFRMQKETIETTLKSEHSVVLHFNFNGHPWHKQNSILDDVDSIILFYKSDKNSDSLVSYLNDRFNDDFIKNNQLSDKLTLNKYLYKTLGGVTPYFEEKNSYKNKIFLFDDIISLMYAGKAAEKPVVRFGNIGIIALPHSDQLSPESVVAFFERNKKDIEEEVGKEDDIVETTGNYDSDLFFTDLVNNDFEDTVKFDIVFTSIPASPAGVFADLIEISDVEKSLLKHINENVRQKANEMENRANSDFPNAKKPFRFHIRTSFLKILGDVTKDKKKFQSHLLKVLPQLYTDNYYDDPLLLSAFLEKVEYNIREGNQSFSTLKYDLYFLMNIQKNNPLMKITESNSYALGKNLGIMARQFAAWRKDCPIKSFEKSYVGNLSRRTSSIEELVKFAAFINEKLVMHEKTKYPEVRIAYQNFVNIIKEFEGERYSKYYSSLGFFESYFDIKQEENSTN